MHWHHRLRWKLFVSHVIIVVIANLVLLATAYFIAGYGLTESAPLTLGGAAAETGQLGTGVSETSNPNQQFEAVILQALLFSAFAALAAAVLVSLFVSRRIVEPLNTLALVSRRLSQGYYRERTEIESDDEIADLSRSVNQLADTLNRTEQRRLSLLADVTHELRTPLATIGGYMEGLLDGMVKPNQATFNLVLRETNRLQRLIEDLELLSRVEAGQLPVVPRSIDLAGLLHEMSVQFQPVFAAGQIQLSCEIADDLPPAWADPDRVNQIMINLLANANRYTLAGGKVLLRVTRQSENDRLLIALQDTGVGIEPDHLPHIFERFYRIDKSRARQSGGSGIGLAIVSHLVYAQGGEIWAESEGVGKGATFCFTLPIVPEAQFAHGHSARATPVEV